MRINSRAGTQEAALDDAGSGEGLSIFFSQSGEAVGRYRVVVKAIIDQGIYDVGEFYISPPSATAVPGRLSRMVGGAVCPGATGWRVSVTPWNEVGNPPPLDETADIVLASSKCCTSPMGASRVNQRYGYIAGTNPATFAYLVLGGQTITGIAAIGLTGGGTIEIDGGDTIFVPEGISANPEPIAPIRPNALIVFDNVDYVIEYLESA